MSKTARRTLARMVRRGYPRETILLTAKQYQLPKEKTRDLLRRTRDKISPRADE